MTPSGIEPVTFRFLAQYLNHCATTVPNNTVCRQEKFITETEVEILRLL